MPAPTRRQRGKDSSSRLSASSRPSSASRNASNAPLAQLQITGWRNSKAANEEDGGLQAFTNWIERKARTNQEKGHQHGGVQKRTIPRIRKSRVEGATLSIHVPAEDVSYYSRVDGFTWAGNTINIRTIGPSSASQARSGLANRRSPAPGSEKPSFSFKSKGTEAIYSSLKGLLFRRYDTDTKVLNLTGILEEPETVEVLSNKTNTMSKLFAVLCAICEDAFPSKEARSAGVTGILLGANKFVSLLPARSLAFEFPDLLNLDVSNNNIAGLEGLSHFRRCTKLEHLILAGNPWEQDVNFKRDVLKAFPNLKIVDGVEITPADREASKDNRVAPPVAQGFYDDSTGLGQKFFQTFFAGFDNDRKGLVEYYYAKNSTFSYAINTRALKDPTSKVTSTKNEWDTWIWDSRNLTRLSANHQRKSRLHTGSQSILDIFQRLPTTEHATLQDPSKWMVESYPVPGLPDPSGQSSVGVNGLSITIHGEFTENASNSTKRRLRSFDRTFILGPGGNNPDGVGIISDMLVVRWYGGTKAFSAGAASVQLSPEQEKAALVEEVQRQTGMNAQFSAMCLEETGWRLQAALESFQTIRANIPPEAFVSV